MTTWRYIAGNVQLDGNRAPVLDGNGNPISAGRASTSRSAFDPDSETEQHIIPNLPDADAGGEGQAADRLSLISEPQPDQSLLLTDHRRRHRPGRYRPDRHRVPVRRQREINAVFDHGNAQVTYGDATDPNDRVPSSTDAATVQGPSRSPPGVLLGQVDHRGARASGWRSPSTNPSTSPAGDRRQQGRLHVHRRRARHRRWTSSASSRAAAIHGSSTAIKPQGKLPEGGGGHEGPVGGVRRDGPTAST